MKFDYPPIFRKKAKNNTLNYKITQNITKPTVFRRKKENRPFRNFSEQFCQTSIYDSNCCLSGIYTKTNRLRIENSSKARAIAGIFYQNKRQIFCIMLMLRGGVVFSRETIAQKPLMSKSEKFLAPALIFAYDNKFVTLLRNIKPYHHPAKQMGAQSKDALLSLIRLGKPMTLQQQLILTAKLSAPAILAQLSSIVMQYIDASMLGRLGTNEAASVGLVSTTIWLFGGLGFAITSGFSVQVAHLIGANDYGSARSVFRQALVTAMLLAVALGALGIGISHQLPLWLGADTNISHDASLYFMVFAATYPFLMLFYLSSAMLRSCGNMKVPSILSITLDALDVVFNFLLIFPDHHISIAGHNITIPGADLGVLGASLGTAFACATTGLIMIWYVCRRSPDLNLKHNKGSFRPTAPCLRRALKIGMPLGIERVVMCGAQIAITAIVAPLGAVAIAANTFGITAESLCYMPGYGISDAATTLVGQSIGAQRNDLTRRFAAIALSLGVLIMSITGAVMYVAAPLMMRLMTPDANIIALGTEILRIEAFAEPMFAASIVCYGIFVGAGDTLAPSAMNFASIWLVRLTLACALVPTMGLKGVWIAMCIELCFRGVIFLSRLRFGNWNKASIAPRKTNNL